MCITLAFHPLATSPDTAQVKASEMANQNRHIQSQTSHMVKREVASHRGMAKTLGPTHTKPPMVKVQIVANQHLAINLVIVKLANQNRGIVVANPMEKVEPHSQVSPKVLANQESQHMIKAQAKQRGVQERENQTVLLKSQIVTNQVLKTSESVRNDSYRLFE